MTLPLLGAGPSAPTGGGGGVDYVARWGVVEHFALAEAGTGNRVGSVVPYTLTNTGAATQGAALAAGLSNSTDFSGSGQFLNAADAAAPLLGAADVPLVVFFWAQIDDKTAVRYAAHKGTGQAAATMEFGFSYQSAVDRFRFAWGDAAGSTLTNLNADTLGSPSVGVTYFFLGYHDPDANLIGLQINGGTADTLTTAGRVPTDTAGAFSVGERPGANRWDGRISGLTFCVSPPIGLAPALAEITSVVYNGGAGAAYPWS
jgi:hypothetical protein